MATRDLQVCDRHMGGRGGGGGDGADRGFEAASHCGGL